MSKHSVATSLSISGESAAVDLSRVSEKQRVVLATSNLATDHYTHRAVIGSLTTYVRPLYVTRGMHPLQAWRSQGSSVFGPLQLLAVTFLLGTVRSLQCFPRYIPRLMALCPGRPG